MIGYRVLVHAALSQLLTGAIRPPQMFTYHITTPHSISLQYTAPYLRDHWSSNISALSPYDSVVCLTETHPESAQQMASNPRFARHLSVSSASPCLLLNSPTRITRWWHFGSSEEFWGYWMYVDIGGMKTWVGRDLRSQVQGLWYRSWSLRRVPPQTGAVDDAPGGPRRGTRPFSYRQMTNRPLMTNAAS